MGEGQSMHQGQVEHWLGWGAPPADCAPRSTTGNCASSICSLWRLLLCVFPAPQALEGDMSPRQRPLSHLQELLFSQRPEYK